MWEGFRIPRFMCFCLGVLRLCVSPTLHRGCLPSGRYHWTGSTTLRWHHHADHLPANVMSGTGGVRMTYGDGVIYLSWTYLTSSSPTDSVCVCLACVLIHHEENAPSAIHTSGEGASKGHAGFVLRTSSSLFPSRWSTYLPIILTASTPLAVRPSTGVQHDSTKIYQCIFMSEKWSEGEPGVSIAKVEEEEKDNKDRNRTEFEIRSLCSVNSLLGFGLCGSSPHRRYMVVTTATSVCASLYVRTCE